MGYFFCLNCSTNMKNGTVIFWGFIPGGTAPFYEQDAVQWTYTAKELPGQTFEIKLMARLQKGWHINKQGEDVSTIPTIIRFNKSAFLELQGCLRIMESLYKEKTSFFEEEPAPYQKTVSFAQMIRLHSVNRINLTGTIQFQAHTDQDSLPPTVSQFDIPLRVSL